MIKTLGDGVLAMFSGPAQAVRCARRIVEARPRALEGRSGVHTSEMERSGDDVAGAAVHLAARITGRAEPERSCSRARSRTSSSEASCASRRAGNTS